MRFGVVTRAVGAWVLTMAVWAGAAAPAGAATRAPALGANVVVIDPSMPQSEIQSKLDSIATQQVPMSSQFTTRRYSILFEPGTYGSPTDPLIFQVGYYTQVAGLGRTPGDVVVNGAIDVFNQCVEDPQTHTYQHPCDALDNFWRSLSNLTLNFHPSSSPSFTPATGEDPGCDSSNEMWAVSQAAPMRRVIMNGTVTLQDYCDQGFASGGFLADDEFNGGTVINAGNQQFFTRNSTLDGWTNGVWNQVFMGDPGAPPTNFGPGSNQYTTLPTTPVSQSEPFLYDDAAHGYGVFVPAVQRNSSGPSYASGAESGTSVPLSDFFIASPSTPDGQINGALASGRNLILTPGVYDVHETIDVRRAGTIVLGLGFATLIPQNGIAALETSAAPGIKLSGMIVDAGPQNSRMLVEIGDGSQTSGSAMGSGPVGPSDPSLVQDVFFRIGGAEPGQATDSLVVNASNVILDDVWAWRADHGAGVGWNLNRADTGVIVNGDHVLAYGLAVEHYQRYEVIWNGQDGEDVFFQNEMPYDPPSQAAWMSSPSTDGYAAFLVSPSVTRFAGYGMGSYSFFNQGVPIYATQAFQSPTRPGVQFNDLLTVFLNANGGSGGINSVIDGTGGSSTAANPDSPVDVNTYP